MRSRKLRHIVPVSGGKDSAAMCVLLHKRLPEAEYVFCDTGSELKETYAYLDKIEAKLGIKIVRLGSGKTFEQWLEYHKNYLPSKRARWCTPRMKIKPFEKYCGKGPVVSYIGIRADEASRKGYFNGKKTNIKVEYPFIDEGIDLEGVKRLLSDSGLGMPEYYRWRSRSGCYFCFFQRRVEWMNLHDEHPDLFDKALALEDKGGYNKDGKKFTWVRGVSLRELLAKKDKIQARYARKVAKEAAKKKQMSILDLRDKILDEESSDRCNTCHI